MNRISLSTATAPNFIGCWTLGEPSISDRLIAFFEDHEDLQSPGATGSGVNPDQKRSVDIAINPKDLTEPGYEAFRDYFDSLQRCYVDYKEQWPFLNTFLDEIHIGAFNLQRYLPGDHFSNLHSERTSLSKLHRIFAFMTYLNDVDDGGTTDFHHYDLKIKPERGKTLIWPAEWTHAHTGGVLGSGKKYIITGWMHFGPESTE